MGMSIIFSSRSLPFLLVPLTSSIRFLQSVSCLQHSLPEHALISAIKDCSSLSQGTMIHSLLIKTGPQSNICIQNSLLHLYARFGMMSTAFNMFDSCEILDTVSWNIMIVGHVKVGNLHNAKIFFDKMPLKNSISYTTLIMGFFQNGRLDEALQLFMDMRRSGVMPTEVTLTTLISTCSILLAKVSGAMIHGISVKTGSDLFVFVSTNLIHMYVCFTSLRHAQNVFDRMTEKNVVTWNVMLKGCSMFGLTNLAADLFKKIPIKDIISWSTMINAYVIVNRCLDAFLTFKDMLLAGMGCSEVTIVNLLSACIRVSAGRAGNQFHAVTVKRGLDSHISVQTAIIHFYASFRQIHEAILQFRFSCKDWTSPWNALIACYSKNDMVECARQLFEIMPARDTVSWSTMIACYAQNRQSECALCLFREMLSTGITPNEISMLTVVSATAHSGALEQGIWVHEYICKNSIFLSDNLCAALIDMYAKCGSVKNALEVFQSGAGKAITVSPWNAIIYGLALHGRADESLNIFLDLLKTDIKPNSVTFIGVLCACCHAGLVETGKMYFSSMKDSHKIEPNIKHYGCMIDLFARAGHFDAAERLIGAMPMGADIVIWITMLSACRIHGNVKLAITAAHCLAELDPSYVSDAILSKDYAGNRMSNDDFSIRIMMVSKQAKKVTGYSAVA